MLDPEVAGINDRVAMGILLREDSLHLLGKLAELEVLLAEARGAEPLPSGSLVVREQG